MKLQNESSALGTLTFEDRLRRLVWLLCFASAFGSLLTFSALDYRRHMDREAGIADLRAAPALPDLNGVSSADELNHKEVFWNDFGVSLLAATAFSIVGWWMVRSSLRHALTPAYALANAMEEVAESGRLDVRLAVRASDCVLQQTYRSFEKLMEKLESRENEIKTHQSELESKISDRTHALRDALDSKDRFLAHMTHELRSPLNSILGFSEIIEAGIQGPISVQQAESLKHIREAGNHLLGVINDILDLAKAQAGEHTIHPEVIDIEDVVQAAIRLVRPQADRKSQSVFFRCESKMDPVEGDRRRIQQIVINLLTNAVKFTRKGKALGVDIAMKDNGEHLSIAVWDQGRGIFSSDQNNLFQPFFQAAGSAERVAGTGIGLALSRSFARLHDGDITVKSKVGYGSRFEVTLPVRRFEAGKPAIMPTA